jgi:hypothetical protein
MKGQLQPTSYRENPRGQGFKREFSSMSKGRIDFFHSHFSLSKPPSPFHSNFNSSINSSINLNP